MTLRTKLRSNRRHIRNPVLALPGVAALMKQSPEQREILAKVLNDIASDARRRAQESWKKNKGPMAAYWKAVGAYAGHLARCMRVAS